MRSFVGIKAMDPVIQLIHIDRKQIPQVIKFIKFVSFRKLGSTVQTENMIDLQCSGRMDG